MANQFSKGHTFVPGEVVDPQDLNDLVDQAIAQLTGGLISEQPTVTADVADYVLIGDTSDSNKLKRSLISDVPRVSSVGLAMPTEFTVTNSPVTTTGTLTAAWKPQPGNKFFAGNGTGTGLTPTFRLIGSEDLAIASVEIAAADIDWSLGNVFHKVLTTSTTFSFSNLQDGQTIKVLIGQAASGSVWAAAFPAGIWWKGAVIPTKSPNYNSIDIWEFTCYGTVVFGKSDQLYLPI